MKLKPGFEAEYQRRHDEIWPELSTLLTAAGISEYSIFLDEETLTLFVFQKLAAANTADTLPFHPLVKKWWDSIAEIMDVNPDHSPCCTTLREVFFAP
jgi:L-rhamnose mutarotase